MYKVWSGLNVVSFNKGNLLLGGKLNVIGNFKKDVARKRNNGKEQNKIKINWKLFKKN